MKKLSRAEAAEFLGLSVPTLNKWAYEGHPKLPYYRLGRKTVYDMADLEVFLAERRIESPADRERFRNRP